MAQVSGDGVEAVVRVLFIKHHTSLQVNCVKALPTHPSYTHICAVVQHEGD
jgi:hypothetical protein